MHLEGAPANSVKNPLGKQILTLSSFTRDSINLTLSLTFVPIQVAPFSRDKRKLN